MRSSLDDIAEFVKSNVWLDIVDLGKARREGLRDELEQGGLRGESTERIGGRCKEIEFFVNIPKVLVAIWQQEIEEERRKKDA